MSVQIFEPSIEPKNGSRQLVSFFMVSYNQERYISEALEGAFAQTYQPLEIILSDDCSSDKTFEIMRKMVSQYKGPHRIVLNQNEYNLGLCGNVNRILDLASGELVVIAAGDDISLPDRVEKSCSILEENPDANSVSFQLQIIDRDGVTLPQRTSLHGQLVKYTLDDFVSQNATHFHGASRAFRKSVYDFFGPLLNNSATEDSTIFLRCILLGSACYSKDIGIYYRVHGDNYYSSDNRHLIKYKRIYWQYIKDINLSVRMGVIDSNVAHNLKQIYRKKLRQNLLMSGYYLSRSKFIYFYSRILFSPMFDFREKAYYFRDAFQTFCRDFQNNTR